MTDSSVEAAADSVTVPEAESDIALAKLEASVRRHRIWLIILTATMVVALCGVTSVVGLTLGVGATLGEPDMAGDEQISKAKQEIELAYGERLRDLEVRAVEVEYGAAPFPYSLMSGGGMESLYIEYGLTGSDVLVANLLESGMFGGGLSTSGMLPTKGSLVSRMELQQFERLLTAYGNQTKAPLGSVRRYGDRPYPTETGVSVPEEVTVGDTSYPTKELWTVSEGRVVKGDSIDMSDESGLGRSSLIFRENTATGEFVFLGTEPAASVW